VDHLKREKQTALEAIASYCHGGSPHEAVVASGGVRVIDNLLELLHPPPKPVDESEPEFIDPALR